MAQLAFTYFTSHGPATLHDFTWWSGLSVAESRHALDQVKSKFVSEIIGEQTYWFTNSFTFPKHDKDLVHILPAFDEFIISYKDRSASLPHESHHKAVSNNGVFRPIIVVNGKVIGIWKRTIKKDKVFFETTFFQLPNKAIKASIDKAFDAYGQFINKKIDMVHCL